MSRKFNEYSSSIELPSLIKGSRYLVLIYLIVYVENKFIRVTFNIYQISLFMNVVVKSFIIYWLIFCFKYLEIMLF